MNKNNKYAFYGSLRKGMYNFDRFKDGLTYERTVQIPGFRLYSLGPYPTALKSDDPNDILTVDLFTVTSTMAYRIDAMERGADYDYVEVDVDGEKYGIYTWDFSLAGRLLKSRVPGGDWVKHLQGDLEEEQV